MPFMKQTENIYQILRGCSRSKIQLNALQNERKISRSSNIFRAIASASQNKRNLSTLTLHVPHIKSLKIPGTKKQQQKQTSPSYDRVTEASRSKILHVNSPASNEKQDQTRYCSSLTVYMSNLYIIKATTMLH